MAPGMSGYTIWTRIRTTLYYAKFLRKDLAGRVAAAEGEAVQVNLTACLACFGPASALRLAFSLHIYSVPFAGLVHKLACFLPASRNGMYIGRLQLCRGRRGYGDGHVRICLLVGFFVCFLPLSPTFFFFFSILASLFFPLFCWYGGVLGDLGLLEKSWAGRQSSGLHGAGRLLLGKQLPRC
jgi:hypothetical protein